MAVRNPIVADHFYPAAAAACRAHVERYLLMAHEDARSDSADEADGTPQPPPAPGHPVAGVVPHAGWMCSGAVAAEVIQALAADPAVETFVIFGAVHRVRLKRASLQNSGSWRSPLGDIEIDEPLATAVLKASPLFGDDAAAHGAEHSIEVQVPFIQHLAPSAKILPVMVPPFTDAPQIGRVLAEQVKALGRQVCFVGSTDLTHYGPNYGFIPHGAGSEGLRWAKEINDRRMLNLVLALQAESIVAEATEHHNACGSGALAAVVAAARAMGATRGRLLKHTTSAEVLRERLGRTSDAVGYAGVLFEASTHANGG